MIIMMTINLLHTMTADAGCLLCFNLSSHSPLLFLHDSSVARKRGSTYPLLELSRLGQAVFLCALFLLLLLESFFVCRCRFVFVVVVIHWRSLNSLFPAVVEGDMAQWP